MPEALKDENGKDLKTREEVEAAFRNKLIRTFNIDDEERNTLKSMYYLLRSKLYIDYRTIAGSIIFD